MFVFLTLNDSYEKSHSTIYQFSRLIPYVYAFEGMSINAKEMSMAKDNSTIQLNHQYACTTGIEIFNKEVKLSFNKHYNCNIEDDIIKYLDPEYLGFLSVDKCIYDAEEIIDKHVHKNMEYLYDDDTIQTMAEYNKAMFNIIAEVISFDDVQEVIEKMYEDIYLNYVHNRNKILLGKCLDQVINKQMLKNPNFDPYDYIQNQSYFLTLKVQDDLTTDDNGQPQMRFAYLYHA